jgi:hypothetical protein
VRTLKFKTIPMAKLKFENMEVCPMAAFVSTDEL